MLRSDIWTLTILFNLTISMIITTVTCWKTYNYKQYQIIQTHWNSRKHWHLFRINLFDLSKPVHCYCLCLCRAWECDNFVCMCATYRHLWSQITHVYIVYIYCDMIWQAELTPVSLRWDLLFWYLSEWRSDISKGFKAGKILNQTISGWERSNFQSSSSCKWT